MIDLVIDYGQDAAHWTIQQFGVARCSAHPLVHC